MQPIGNLLPKRINQLGLLKPLQAARVVAVANEVSQGRFRPVSFARAGLTITCSNSIIAQETRLSSQSLIKQINDRLGQPLVKRIYFRIN